MDVSAIVKAIDDRIATLQQAKDLLSTTAIPATEKRAKAAVAAIQPAKAGAATKATSGGRKPMSEEGRARIAAAQKKRWALKHAGTAAAKKASPANAAKKLTPVKKSAKKVAPAKKSAAKKAAAEATPPAEATEN